MGNLGFLGQFSSWRIPSLYRIFGLTLWYTLRVRKILPSDKIYISQSKILSAGRGVFAKVDIMKGEVIEQCPFIEFPEDDALVINDSMLIAYIYYLGKNKERSMILLGFGSIYNHSDKPNAKYKERYKDNIVDFIAINQIKKNEEITVNYIQSDDKHSPLWFES